MRVNAGTRNILVQVRKAQAMSGTLSTRLNHSGFELISWAVLNIKSELPWDASEFLRLNLSLFDPSAFIDFRQ